MKTDIEEPVASAKKMSVPLTGSEYLESLKDGRQVWIYGEKVKDVTSHPAFRNSARILCVCLTLNQLSRLLFKRTLGQWASGVTVITTVRDGAPHTG